MLAEAKQFRETIAIERAIESDAAARQAWVQRQLTLDPVSIGEMMGGSGEPIRVRLRQEELPSTEPSMPA